MFGWGDASADLTILLTEWRPEPQLELKLMRVDNFLTSKAAWEAERAELLRLGIVEESLLHHMDVVLGKQVALLIFIAQLCRAHIWPGIGVMLQTRTVRLLGMSMYLGCQLLLSMRLACSVSMASCRLRKNPCQWLKFSLVEPSMDQDSWARIRAGMQRHGLCSAQRC